MATYEAVCSSPTFLQVPISLSLDCCWQGNTRGRRYGDARDHGGKRAHACSGSCTDLPPFNGMTAGSTTPSVARRIRFTGTRNPGEQ
jgi:hypothetical protein